jgi:UDP-2,3-diacylglucosamine pyrophosphatase LpxH
MGEKRALEAVILSDLHLGTFGCHAREILKYLKSIRPETIILNGDIIDIWNFKKSYFPKAHLKVLKYLITLAQKGTKVIYITGNHDELLRKFADSDMGHILLRNQVVLEFKGKKTWIFHGDIFDASIQNARWLAKLGGWSYDLLIWINHHMNVVLTALGREKYSLSKVIKDSVKKAVKYVNDFEQAAAEMAASRGYHQVICGHIHHPQIRTLQTAHGPIDYLNSGDWIENLTALEWDGKNWSLFTYPLQDILEDERDDKVDSSPYELMAQVLHEY